MPCKILLTGHELKSKCNVANALCKQRNLFRELSSRMKCLGKMVKETTLSGLQIHVVLSPNLNTPAWAQAAMGMKTHPPENLVICYVRNSGLANINHEASIKYLRDFFEKRPVITVNYAQDEHDANMTAKKDDDLVFRADLSFERQTEAAKSILGKITETLTQPSQQVSKEAYSRKEEVPGTKTVYQRPKLETQFSHLKFTDEEMEKIQVPQKTAPLPEPTNDDWRLLSTALSNGKASSNHIRVNIVGNQRVGKTTLMRRLQRRLSSCKDQESSPTEALSIEEITLRCVQNPKNKDTEWQSNDSGFLYDLNIQRMAEALSSVKPFDKDRNNAGNPEELDIGVDDDILYSSECIDDDIIEELSFLPYKEMYSRQERTEFLQDVIAQWQKGGEKQVYLSFWDYAGQSTYYSTHQAFMSPNAVYLLVFNLSSGFDDKMVDCLNFRTGGSAKCTVRESLVFWASSIKTFTSDTNGGRAPIILVGTHGDLVDDQTAEQKFNEARKIIGMELVNCIKINNTVEADFSKSQNEDPNDLQELRRLVLNCGLGIADESVPARWIDLQNALGEKRRQGSKIISFTTLQDINKTMDIPVEHEESLHNFLEHLHCRGQLLYFPTKTQADLSNNIIILEPNALVELFNKIMRTADSKCVFQSPTIIDKSNRNGIVSWDFLKECALTLLEGDEQNSASELLKMLEHLKIIYLLPIQTECILPSLLPDRTDRITEEPRERGPKLKIAFKVNQVDRSTVPVPVGFYNHLVVSMLTEIEGISLFEEEDTPQIYKTHACLQYSQTEAILTDVYWKEYAVFVHVNNYSTDKSLAETDLNSFIIDIEKVIKLTLDIYRQSNICHFLGIECYEHEDTFLSVEKLRRDGKAMCSKRHMVTDGIWSPTKESPENVSGNHEVTTNDLNKELKLNIKQAQPDGSCDDDLNHKHISRLARFLTGESAHTLAKCLKIRSVVAEEIKNNWQNTSVQRMYVMVKWQNKRRGEGLAVTLKHLIDLLTESEDFTPAQLYDVAKKEVEYKQIDGLEGLTSKIVSEQMLLKIIQAEVLGIGYEHTMIELDLHFVTIQQYQIDHPKDMKQAIMALLLKWKQNNPNKCTLGTLLNTMQSTEIELTGLVKALLCSFSSSDEKC